MFNSKSRACLFLAVVSVFSLVAADSSLAQTYMRQRGERTGRSALSLMQALNNLMTQQQSSATVYAMGAGNVGPTNESLAGGVGIRVRREEAYQFVLEYIQGQTFLRGRFSGDLVQVDLNLPMVGSPLMQALLQTAGNNIMQGLRNAVCDSVIRDTSHPCRNDDEFSQEMELANNRRTTSIGLRGILLGVDGQYLRQRESGSTAGAYVILSPSILLNVLHIDYSTLQNSGLSSLAFRIGGSPVAFGAGVSGSQTALGAGGEARAEFEMVYHLGGGHFVSMEALYRFFGAYHEVDGNSMSAIHSLKSYIGYSYWPSHRQGTGAGFFARPGYELNVVDVSSGAHPNGEATVNHVPGVSVGVEF